MKTEKPDMGGQIDKGQEERYESLRKKMGELKQIELAKGDKRNPAFDYIDPDAYSEKELELFDRYIEKALTKEDAEFIQESRRSLGRAGDIVDKLDTDPHRALISLLVNELVSPEYLRKFQPDAFRNEPE